MPALARGDGVAVGMAMGSGGSRSGWWSQAGPQAGETAVEHLQGVILGAVSSAPLRVLVFWC